MLKSIQVKLLKVKYGGSSIGRDIHIEVEMFGKFLRVDKKMRAGTTVEINQEVGGFESERGILQAGVTIAIIEKDLLFNDIGSTKGNMKINTASVNPQQFVFEMEVRETRSIFGKFWGARTAIFEIILQAESSDTMKYIPDIDQSQGFLKVKLEGDKPKEEFLPAYLKVKKERVEAKREHLTILEGPYRGRPASVGMKSESSSWLISSVKHEPMTRAKYSISQKKFILNGKQYQTVDYPEMPWRKGIYDIEIPDYPHEGGRHYLDRSKRAMTWFRIGHNGARYLHAGGRSLGCMTVIEVERWMEIYNALIKTRKGDFLSVGVLEVVD